MRTRARVLLVLAVVVLLCEALSLASAALRHQNWGQATDVVDGARPGTVTLRTESADGVERWWLIDDSGRAVGTVQESGGGLGQPRTQDCTGEVCYRVGATALRVDGSRDGGVTYMTAWEVGGEDYVVLARTYPDIENPAQDLSSRSVVVHAASGGHVVFVADGRDGLLYRDVNGTWHRLGLPGSGEGCCYYNPPVRISSDPPVRDFTVYAVAVVSVAVLSAGGIAATVRRRWRWSGMVAVLAIAALAGFGTEVAGHFPDVGMFPGWVYGAPLILLALVVGITLAVWVAVAPRPERSRASVGPSPPH